MDFSYQAEEKSFVIKKLNEMEEISNNKLQGLKQGILFK